RAERQRSARDLRAQRPPRSVAHRFQDARNGWRRARRAAAPARTRSESALPHGVCRSVVHRTRRAVARRGISRKALHRQRSPRSSVDDPLWRLRRLSGPCIILISSLSARVLMEAQDRSKRVLAALVREFISSGEPVASSLLVSAAGLGVSSATVRSILARLEEEGFVQQPHTSAGRIPTDRGYRFYVDLLLEAKRSVRTASAVEARLRRDGSGPMLDSVLSRVSHVLSQASRQVGFALRPAHEAAVFDRVEFVPLSAARVLVVIVARGGHVIQKVVDVGESLSIDDLREAANYLNTGFSGVPLYRA